MLWIVIVAVLLAGVVAVNVAALQLNVESQRLDERRDKALAANAAAQSRALEPRRRVADRRRRQGDGARPGVRDELRAAAAQGPVSQKTVNRRVRLLVGIFTLAFAVVLARAGWIEAVRGRRSRQLAANQHREEVTVPARRGTIYDRTGVEIAIGERAMTVYANPKQIRDPRAVAIAAGRALGVKPEKLYEQLQDKSLGFVYLARKADPDKVEALDEAGARRRRLLSRGAAHVSARERRVRGGRLRGPRQQGPRRARADARQAARAGATARRRSCATRSATR